MTDPIRNLLGSYLDGELDRRHQQEVQAHLATCQSCRDELEEIRRLAERLRSAPQPHFTPAQQFKAQVMLQLPRQVEIAQPVPHRRVLPWAVPVLVLAGWVFLQVTLGLSTLVSLAHRAGILDGAAAWAGSGPQQTWWYTALQSTLGSLLDLAWIPGLQALNDAGLFAQNLILPLLLQIGVAALYWGAFWLLWNPRKHGMWTWQGKEK